MKLHYIDLFCGAGGTTTGIEEAHIGNVKCADVIACVNHDPNAIASHLANHPKAHHFTEDIRTLDVSPLASLAEGVRRAGPGDYIVLWASLECTNFSRAKGGQPRDADSRTLAEHLFRYIDAIRPDYIQIENVEEFMCWGELDENGHPVSMTRGRDYLRWVRNVKRRGYDFDYKILNSANYGAYTSRKRYFGVFARKGLPIVFPEPTHCKNGSEGIFGHMDRWKAVGDVLDLEDEGRSIFDPTRKRLSENTLKRIYAGLVKFVAGGKDAFRARLESMVRSDVQPEDLRFAKVCFLSKQFSGNPDEKNIGIDGPAGSVTCIDHHAFITACLGKTPHDRVTPRTLRFVDNQYGNGSPSDIRVPANTVTTNPKMNLVSARFLMNPQFASAGSAIDKPCFTLIASMDKRPPYIVTAEKGTAAAVYEDDSPMTVKIKEFMALYGISDIFMRMLNITELKRIMGFPSDYVLIGTQTEQKKFIGNAVEVNMSRRLCEALYAPLLNLGAA